MAYLSVEEVQMFLNGLKPLEQFAVMFHWKDGTQAVYLGTLDPNKTTEKNLVSFRLDSGSWRCFSRDRVLWIGYPDQLESCLQALAGSK